MNKLLTAIEHKISEKRYPQLAGLSVSVEDIPQNPIRITEERQITSRIEFYSRSIVPTSQTAYVKREHFGRIQGMLYGDLYCMAGEAKYLARRHGNQELMDIIDEMLTEMGYLS